MAQNPTNIQTTPTPIAISLLTPTSIMDETGAPSAVSGPDPSETEAATAPVVTQEKEKEDIVAKYKRLLAMARSSLESNQVSLLEKDSQIKKLKKLYDEEALKVRQQTRAAAGAEEDSDNLPRRIIRHLKVDDTIHILVEYTGSCKDTWVQFGSEVELADWMQSVPGVPLVLPQKCLTIEESSRIVCTYSWWLFLS
jgi:hypothetical protein